jgi:hypothetical protein
MKEDLLHFIWQQKVLLKNELRTTDGKLIEVVKTGSLNQDAGPDFFNARIKIDDTLWAGNVEIHLKSSDWVKHKHHTDKAYNNVILHVVYDHDAELNIPTLELKNYLSKNFLSGYYSLQQSALRVPCQNMLSLPEKIKLELFLHRLSVERLEQKCAALERQLTQYQNSWEKLFYVTTAKYFGMKINAEPFVQLAQNIPAALFAKHKHNLTQINSLVFGVSGFLPPLYPDDYTNQMQNEFLFLQTKYELPQINKSAWKFAKTRPANFPTIRLAQFAALVYQSVHLFSKIIESETLQEVKKLLLVSPTDRLNLNTLHLANHIVKPVMGEQFLNHLIINTIVPIKFLYGKHMLNETYCEQALNWLEEIEPENNSIVKFWKTSGIKPKHALHSQALIQLNHNYCAQHKCLNCAIGNHILNQHV